MSRPSLFDALAEELEARTSFDSLEARGTVRLALRKAGLEPGKLTREHTNALVEKILPEELRARGVDEVDGVCHALLRRVAGMPDESAVGHRPETLFERLRRPAP